MTTKQLYAGNTKIYPESGYERDKAAEKIQRMESSIEQIQSKTYTAEEVGADEKGSAGIALGEAKKYTDEVVSGMIKPGTILASYDLPGFGAVKAFDLPGATSMISITIRVHGRDEGDTKIFTAGNVINIPFGLWEIWTKTLYLADPYIDFNFTSVDKIRVSAITGALVTTNGVKKIQAGYRKEEGSSDLINVIAAKIHFIA